MDLTVNLDQAAEYANSALKLMAAREIPATPANFTVWYAYYAGQSEELTRALDVLLSNKVEFTPERNHEVYDKYFGFEGEGREIRETTSRLQAAVNHVLEYLGEAGRDQSAYGEKLAGFSGDLAKDAGGGQVAELVRGILSETQQIIEKSEALESRLGQSSQQIGELRQHLEEVQREAMTDALTGIANRKYFDATLRAGAKNAMETGDDLCLLMIDIDHFKRFNDTYGHLIGDEVLRVVARLLTENVKGRDTPARYGGEEFTVILPHTGLSNAATVAEQIRNALASRKVHDKRTDQSYGTLTVSIGVAKFQPGEPLDTLIQRADQALYRAKNQGRNRVVTEDELDSVVDLAG
ncbi:MAG: GGDEF domain-containing protein [Planctomycetota bacterium]|jgi:diguanylate cyclase